MAPVPIAGNDLWYILPLVISVSLVYAGTRAEQMSSIVRGAVRFGGWVLAFLLVILGVIELLTWMT